MDLALFAPGLGYYATRKERVGRSPQTDFYTSTSVGPLFGELVVDACRKLLKAADLAPFTFIEVGAEPGGGLLQGVRHPFGQARTVRLGEPFHAEGPCVVFSNELFDAQPCRRFLSRGDCWVELGVTWDSDGQLEEVELGDTDLPDVLPASLPAGYHLDLPLASVELLRHLCTGPWHGLFLAFDYGKSWAQLCTETPQGTARAYSKHRQSNDLLAQPTQQDLTCHVCWDWLAETLAQEGFREPEWETQERFLVRHAEAALAQISRAEATGLSQRKLALMQLLHPANLGQKFQALHAIRPPR